MKAIVWKEVRENALWAAVASAGLGVFLVFMVREQLRLAGTDPGRVLETVEMATVFGAPLIAGLLGFLQSVREASGGRWELLAHLPVERSVVFVAKLASGLALYLAAVATPYLACSFWVSSPGVVAGPFDDASRFLPGVVDLVAGTGYYFAGLLAGFRSARWFGSRFLGFFWAGVGSVIAHEGPFVPALATCGGIVLVLAIAAWGTLSSGGAYRSQSPLQRMALGVILTVAMTVIGGAVLENLASLTAKRTASSMTRYAVDRSGRILRLRYTFTPSCESPYT